MNTIIAKNIKKYFKVILYKFISYLLSCEYLPKFEQRKITMPIKEQ